MEFLTIFTILILLITLISLVNERTVKMPNEIALLLFSFLICLALRLGYALFSPQLLERALAMFRDFQFESYLMDGVLCFMLFAGAGQVHFKKFTVNLKNITLLSLAATALSSVLFGLLFYGVTHLLGLELDIWVCILLGCIISPTDPIAATGIMNKLGLSKNITTIIESESLFNDGMGVVLFAFFKSIVSNMGQENFLLLMLREALGAAAVALLVSGLLFLLVPLTRKPINHVFISILTVSAAYLICEICGFSGPIASVICGMYFSYHMEKLERLRQVIDPGEIYNDFWEVVDGLLNSVLFVLIGISTLRLSFTPELVIAGLSAVVCTLLSRAAGVGVPTALAARGRFPGGYNLSEYVLLMTWSALKGGLSLALVISTQEFLPQETYRVLLEAVYTAIFFTVIVQGLTTKKMYRFIERHKSLRIRKGE